MREFSRKIIAILLLFLFVEKVGLRLFLHNRLHQSTISAVSSKQKNTPKQSISQQDCGCLDDFFIPLSQTEEAALPLPNIAYIDTIASFKYDCIQPSPTYSIQLRGPPSA